MILSNLVIQEITTGLKIKHRSNIEHRYDIKRGSKDGSVDEIINDFVKLLG